MNIEELNNKLDNIEKKIENIQNFIKNESITINNNKYLLNMLDKDADILDALLESTYFCISLIKKDNERKWTWHTY